MGPHLPRTQEIEIVPREGRQIEGLTSTYQSLAMNRREGRGKFLSYIFKRILLRAWSRIRSRWMSLPRTRPLSHCCQTWEIFTTWSMCHVFSCILTEAILAWKPSPMLHVPSAVSSTAAGRRKSSVRSPIKSTKKLKFECSPLQILCLVTWKETASLVRI